MKKSVEDGAKLVKAKIRPVARVSISEEIAKQIIDLISSGDLQPGQRLPSERELCEHFGASRSSLREALRCLSIVGVLNARVGDGTTVAADGGRFLRKIVEWRLITEKHDIENLMEVRVALEGVSAANAALRSTREEIEKLRELLAAMRAAKEANKFAVLDVEFHVTLAKSSGNAFVFDLVSMIRGHLEKVIPRILLIPNSMPLSLQEHETIFRAIEHRDPDAARDAMHAHLQAVVNRYVDAGKQGIFPRKKTSDGKSVMARIARSRG